jgi:ketosteroid isomerase-like protein
VQVDEATAAGLSALLPQGDWVEAMGRPGYEERLAALRTVAASDLEVEMVGPGGAFRQSFRGVEGFRDAWADWLAPFESYHLEPEEWRQGDDRLVFLGRQKAIPKGGGSEVTSDAAAVLFFDAGMLKRVEFHLDRAAALRSAGLDPS